MCLSVPTQSRSRRHRPTPLRGRIGTGGESIQPQGALWLSAESSSPLTHRWQSRTPRRPTPSPQRNRRSIFRSMILRRRGDSGACQHTSRGCGGVTEPYSRSLSIPPKDSCSPPSGGVARCEHSVLIGALTCTGWRIASRRTRRLCGVTPSPERCRRFAWSLTVLYSYGDRLREYARQWSCFQQRKPPLEPLVERAETQRIATVPCLRRPARADRAG